VIAGPCATSWRVMMIGSIEKSPFTPGSAAPQAKSGVTGKILVL
jgi:hypothetical protein